MLRGLLFLVPALIFYWIYDSIVYANKKDKYVQMKMAEVIGFTVFILLCGDFSDKILNNVTQKFLSAMCLTIMFSTIYFSLKLKKRMMYLNVLSLVFNIVYFIYPIFAHTYVYTLKEYLFLAIVLIVLSLLIMLISFLVLKKKGTISGIAVSMMVISIIIYAATTFNTAYVSAVNYLL